MTNPTLVAQDTAWSGWTVTQLLDEVLRPFGLTNDSATDRVVASTDESTLARDAVRLALTYLNTQYPNVWARRIYSVTWTSGDHSIIVPANCKFIERVFYGGLPLQSLSLEDRTRLVREDDQGGGWKITSEKPEFYYISGIADNGGTGADWRMVMRLVNTPGSGYDTETLTVHYIAKSVDLASADDADYVEIDILYHDWVVNRAVEIMAGKLGGAQPIAQSATGERSSIEKILWDHLEGTGEYPDRLRWSYPPAADYERR
jgi:hypothetical protein